MNAKQKFSVYRKTKNFSGFEGLLRSGWLT